MDLFAGPYAAAALLLVVGGALEVVRPAASLDALAHVGVAVPARLVRALGAAGVLVGLLAVALGGGAPGRSAAVAVAVAYAGFAGFVAVARARAGRDPRAGASAAPTPRRGRSTWCSTWPRWWPRSGRGPARRGLPGAVADQPAAGVPFVLVTLACAALAYAVFTLVGDAKPRTPRRVRGPRE